MTLLRNRRATHAALLLGVVATALLVGPSGSHVVTATAPVVAGFGFWETLSCVACLTGFIVGAGTTVAGLAVFLAAYPEIAILCVSTCSIAVS